MMNTNKFMQGALRAGVCLFLLSGSCVLSAQTEKGGDAPATTVSKTAPKYEMKKISGKVVDASTKKPLVGVRVQALNNRFYTTMTDQNGEYTISVPKFVNSLYVSCDDYNAVQIAIKGETGQDASLYSGIIKPLYEDGTQVLDVHKMALNNTSAITIENDIENSLNSSVRTISRGGMPGLGAVMFINGLNSLNANSQPLVIIDGVIQDMQYDRTAIHDGFYNNVLSIIDPEDIENVEVIKNGTALYGARGSNGVIKITTRRGKSMVTSIKIRAYGGFEQVPDKISVMDGDQYRGYVTEFLGTTMGNNLTTSEISSRLNSSFLNEDPGYLFYPIYHNNTDWQKDLYHTAFTQNYKVSVEGGDDVAMYNLSLGYTGSDATAKNNDFNRLNIRFNTDVVMFKNLTAAIDFGYARNAYNLLDNGWAPDYSNRNISSPNVLGLTQAPFLSKYAHSVAYDDGQLVLLHANGTVGRAIYSGKNPDDLTNPFNFATNFGSQYSGLVNPFWILANGNGNNKNSQEQTQFSVNFAPKYQINRYLYVQDRFSYILSRSNEKYYLPNDGTPYKEVENLGDVRSVVRSQFSKETSIYNDFMVNWARQFGAHYINLLGGFRISSNSFDNNWLVGYNNSNDKMPDMSAALSYRDNGGVSDTWTTLSYYLNASYNFQNKYFLDFATSMDASSRFGKETKEGIKLAGVKWGIFPSVQAAWLISSEKWFKAPGIDYLKLTLGYEESGNDNLDYYASRTYFANVKFMDKATSLVISNISNPTIQWETTRKWNVGLQANTFNNRVNFGINFFRSNTSNLLTLKSVSDITGLPSMWANEGALRNTGVEFNANVVLLNRGDWKWQAGFGIGHYRNKITELPKSSLNYIETYALNADGTRDEASLQRIHGYLNSIYGESNILTAVGRPVGVFYGYQTAGVFASDAEAKAAGNGDYLRYPTGLKENPYRNFKAGDVHFIDQNGDGWINEADMVEIGDPNPDIYGNFYTNLSWKNLTLDLVFKYSLGNDVFNYQRSMLESMNSILNQTTAVVNRWRYDGQQTDMPRTMATTSDEWVNNERFSDRWIEDGSYLKLKKVRLTYKIPLSPNISWLQGLSVWGEANNVFTLTKYLGSDPEFTCGNGVLYQGIDAGMLPSNRNFNIGVTINL